MTTHLGHELGEFITLAILEPFLDQNLSHIRQPHTHTKSIFFNVAIFSVMYMDPKKCFFLD